jgi:predicted ATPase
MISEIQIENFKSIAKLSLNPGSLTVLIGENGSGKSNILEAIAFAGAAASDKLDDEFLFLRGVRVTEKDWIMPAFDVPPRHANREIRLKVAGGDNSEPFEVHISRPMRYRFSSRREVPKLFDRWQVAYEVRPEEVEREVEEANFAAELEKFQARYKNVWKGKKDNDEVIRNITALMLARRRKRQRVLKLAGQLALRDFLIYAPENSVLRRFEEEGAIKPLGTKGEGLLKLLQTTAETENGKFAAELKSRLNLLGWFQELHLPTEADEMKGRLRIRDRWLSSETPPFDQRSANEGFLYILFYFTLFLSKQTPSFFAIDNIDNSLNPKLCSELTRQLADLAEKSGKQVICTTHNPAILDGLNLQNDCQRLYVVRRNSEGHTVVNRVRPPRPRPDGASIRLSNAFMSGMLGGLPEHF